MKQLHKHTNKFLNKTFTIGLLTVATVLHLFENRYNLNANNIQIGSINSGDAVNITGNIAVQTNDINSKGGGINFKSEVINTGALNSVGGDVNFAGTSQVRTANITSRGGLINVNSDKGQINTNALDSGGGG